MGAYDATPILESRYDATGRQTYWSKGYKGQGVKVAVIDDFGTEHGYQMASIKDYVAPECELIKLDMKGDYYTLIDKVKEAIKLKVNIISISRSVDFDTSPMHDAVKLAKANNIIVVCSAGNNGNKYMDWIDIKQYPAYYEETLSVLSINNDFSFSTLSSHNKMASICQFGQNILVKNSKGEEMLVTGTSPTTAICSFTIALHWCKILKDTGVNPTYSHMMDFIKNSVVDLNVVGKDNFTGYGFFTLDKKEFERIKLMILDSDNDGLSQRVNRIRDLILSGKSLEESEKLINMEYHVIGYETINGVQIPIYGGRKQSYQ